MVFQKVCIKLRNPLALYESLVTLILTLSIIVLNNFKIFF